LNAIVFCVVIVEKLEKILSNYSFFFPQGKFLVEKSIYIHEKKNFSTEEKLKITAIASFF